MYKKTTGILWLLLLVLTAVPSLYAQEPVERIIAVVGKEPIMASELAAQIQLYAIQTGFKPNTQEDVDNLQRDILEQMINERLFLLEAKKDTSIRIGDDEVDMAVDQQIAQVADQFESENEFLSELSKEGMSLRQYRKKLRPEIENQLYKQRMINKKISEISLTQKEVLEFYDEYKDSIPIQPEAIRLSHILITFQPSKLTEDSVKALAEAIRDSAVAGADFTDLATRYSSGPTALNGGDLGFVSSDDVVPEFGSVAFKLNPGDISGIVRTEIGYHIIKCEEIRRGRSHLRQIFFDVTPTAIDSLLSYQLVDSLIRELDNGADFKELAKVYSADDDSRKQGGELGWFSVDNLPPGFAAGIDSLNGVGSYYGPVPSDYGLHILKEEGYSEEHKLNPDEDFDRIKDLARRTKTDEFVANWLKQVKERTYVEIRLDEE